ncbi:DUF1877 family protein [Streptomyces griseoincarnatus]|uniref:YfbM family protein n=1 Tax=Streptomyces griseoincarnatus TaxID=29305 RepID=A0ABT0VZF3_STRGI|nr:MULTISPECIES: DUF1877 family protein [Streptomyces]MBJ6613317.1 DUF1877 family protein [Streptomyces sp. I3(2020)]MBJ6623714.1 DUF1877 family protein [Streptomyces sp. I4(2020)]MCM2515621.1 YfbM family protein [Streptomyces griseoincarnatus]
MSIEFTMRRISPNVYDRMMSGEPPFPYRYVAESGQIAKRWEVTAFILANGDQTNPGPAMAIVGGRGISDGPDDYGGLRAFSAAEVVTVAQALAELSEDEFRRRFERLDFTGVYGSELDGRPANDIDSYLDCLYHLRDFYSAAAQAGNAMMLWLG